MWQAIRRLKPVNMTEFTSLLEAEPVSHTMNRTPTASLFLFSIFEIDCFFCAEKNESDSAMMKNLWWKFVGTFLGGVYLQKDLWDFDTLMFWSLSIIYSCFLHTRSVTNLLLFNCKFCDKQVDSIQRILNASNRRTFGYNDFWNKKIWIPMHRLKCYGLRANGEKNMELTVRISFSSSFFSSKKYLKFEVKLIVYNGIFTWSVFSLFVLATTVSSVINNGSMECVKYLYNFSNVVKSFHSVLFK